MASKFVGTLGGVDADDFSACSIPLLLHPCFLSLCRAHALTIFDARLVKILGVQLAMYICGDKWQAQRKNNSQLQKL